MIWKILDHSVLGQEQDTQVSARIRPVAMLINGPFPFAVLLLVEIGVGKDEEVSTALIQIHVIYMFLAT